MELNRFKVSHACLFAGVLALTQGLSSCSDYDNGYTEKGIAYKEQFVDMFGTPDPNHTWNMASQVCVQATINLEGTYTVKVYTANPRYADANAYLLGQFEGVEGGGTRSFMCDIPANVTVPYVGLIDKDGNRLISPAELTDGVAKVEFGVAETRTVFASSNNGITVSATKQKVFTKDEVLHPTETLPEFGNNTGKVSQNFEYVSSGSFTFYPIYSITSNKGSTKNGERIGIYTYDANGNVIKDGDEPRITWIWQSDPYWLDARQTGTSTWDQLYAFNLHGTDHVEGAKYWYDDGAKTFINTYDAIRTQGITVSIPVGTRFGIVIDTEQGNYYSNSDYNKDEGAPIAVNSTTPDGVNDTYAATFYSDGMLYLAFEDWNYGLSGHDNDFNDVVFAFDNEFSLPSVIDKDVADIPMTYIVACEDLGGTFDWDFNDVVFAIEHVSGLTTARLKLLAAGGTLPVQIEYKKTENSQPVVIEFKDANGNLKADLHEAFGVDLRTPVNVNAGYSADPLYSEYFNVGDINSFSVSTHADRFQIHVTYEDGSEAMQIHIPNKADTEHKEPQAFLVADPNWKWPDELQCITIPYEDFTTWVSDHLKGERKNWCLSIWGETEAYNAISKPAGATDVIDLLYSQNSSNYTWDSPNNSLKDYSTLRGKLANNQVLYIIDCAQMPSNYNYYDLGIVTSAHATIEFFKPKATTGEEFEPIETMPNGEIVPGKRTSFMFDSQVLNQLKALNANGRNGYVLITFDGNYSSKNPVDDIDYIYWYGHDEIALVDAGFAIIGAGSDNDYLTLTFEANDRDARTFQWTSFSEGAVQCSSSDGNVVTVDNSGRVTPVKPGRAYIRVTQQADVTYKSTTTYVIVDVKGYNADATIDPSSLFFDTNSASTMTITYETLNTEVAPTVESSNTDVVTVSSPSNQGVQSNGKTRYAITVTRHNSGTARVKVSQPTTTSYWPSEVSIPVSVDVPGTQNEFGTQVSFSNQTGNFHNYWVSDGDACKWWSIPISEIHNAVSNRNNGLEIVMDFRGTYGLGTFYVGSTYKGSQWTLKASHSQEFSTEHCSFSSDRILVISITKDEWENTFGYKVNEQGQLTDGGNTNFYFGGDACSPVAVYVRKH